MAYCEVSDLLVGKIPLPAYLDPQKFIDDAADEIDSKIGFRYHTPIDVTDTSQVVKPVRLLLKRLNNFIATGRLIMAVSSNSEQRETHNYALRLVQEAYDSLDVISKGQLELPGAVPLDTAGQATANVPLISNKDAESSVDAFYDRIANPNYTYWPFAAPLYGRGQYRSTEGMIRGG